MEDEDVQMPVEGPGRVKQLMVLAREKNFAVTVEVDRKAVVDGTFTELQELSTEFTDVAAYEKNGEYLVNVTNYPFREQLKLAVAPGEEITFSELRAEIVTVDRPHLDKI